MRELFSLWPYQEFGSSAVSCTNPSYGAFYPVLAEVSKDLMFVQFPVQAKNAKAISG